MGETEHMMKATVAIQKNETESLLTPPNYLNYQKKTLTDKITKRAKHTKLVNMT